MLFLAYKSLIMLFSVAIRLGCLGLKALDEERSKYGGICCKRQRPRSGHSLKLFPSSTRYSRWNGCSTGCRNGSSSKTGRSGGYR